MLGGALAALLVFWVTLKAVRRHQHQLERLASVDGLTGLLNRQEAQRQIKRTMRQQIDANTAPTAMFFDVDFFKKINDSAGHQVGDTALVAVARAIKQHVPQDAVLARWGGEEFFVMLPKSNLEDVATLAEAIRQAIAKLRVAGLEPNTAVTVSCGVGALMRNETFEAFFARVDAALYRAKANGRNCVERSVVSNWGN